MGTECMFFTKVNCVLHSTSCSFTLTSVWISFIREPQPRILGTVHKLSHKFDSSPTFSASHFPKHYYRTKLSIHQDDGPNPRTKYWHHCQSLSRQGIRSGYLQLRSVVTNAANATMHISTRWNLTTSFFHLFQLFHCLLQLLNVLQVLALGRQRVH
jgi:hypothetical protein